MKIVKIKNTLTVFLRILMGIMWIMASWTWLNRDNPSEYLALQLDSAIQKDLPAQFYLPFLQEVVLPYKYLFSLLVSIGGKNGKSDHLLTF